MTTGSRTAKDALFDALASIARALASGRRAEVVELLAQGERSVDEIAEAIGQSVANTSHHLRTLARAGLVDTRREGTRVFYRLSSPHVAALWRAIREVAATEVTQVDRLAAEYLGDRGRLQAVSREELARRLHDERMVVLDVRPTPEYRSAHIAGAVSLPVSELARRLAELPEDAEVVAYCRGPYCVYADDAVRALTRTGRRAARLQDGFPEWAAAGLPVEHGEGDRPFSRADSAPTAAGRRSHPTNEERTMPTKPTKGDHGHADHGSQESGHQKATAGSSVTSEEVADARNEALRNAAEDGDDER